VAKITVPEAFGTGLTLLRIDPQQSDIETIL